MKPRPPFPFALLWFWLGRIFPVWLFVGFVIFMVQIAICKIVHDNENVKTFLSFLDILPSFVKTVLGGDMLQVGNVVGLILIGYQHPLVLFLYLLFAVGVPNTLLTGEVQRGTMEVILSRPVTKTQVYLCATVLTLGGLLALVGVMFLGTVVATSVFDFGQPIPLDVFFRIAVNGGLVAGAAGAIALLAAGSLAGRSRAIGVTVAVLVLDYFAWIFAQLLPGYTLLKRITLFYYSSSVKLGTGWPLRDFAVLLALILVCTAVGGIFWRRRDLAA